MLYKLSYWVVLAIAVCGLAGMVYLVGQQNLRMEANDPQIQMSEDIARGLDQGQSEQSLLFSYGSVDMRLSLAPFVMIYSDSGQPTYSTVKLDGQIPTVPHGVFVSAKEAGQSRFTWQPKPGVREAVVLTRYSHGFVLAGRSLRETEKREDMLLVQVVAAWVVILVSTFVVSVVLGLMRGKKSR